MIKLIVAILVLIFSFNANARMCPGNIGGTGAAGDTPDDPCDTEVQSCITSNNDTDSYVGQTYRWKASKFAATATKTICSAKVHLKKVGNPSFNITVSIYGSTGTEPDESNILSTSDSVSASTLTTSYQYIEFTGLDADITDTTEYWIVITASAVGDSTNYVYAETDTGCDYEEGVKYSTNGTSWIASDSGRGLNYYLYE